MLYTSNRKDVKRLSEKASNRIIWGIVFMVILCLFLGGANFK